MQELQAGPLTAARTGAGRDLVVLHSLLTDRHAFDPVLAKLAARYRVTLLNLPGFHGSPAVAGTMAAYVAAIEQAFSALGINRDAVLMGNGFGGTVALGFALAHQDRIAKLLLADVAARFPDQGKQAFRIMAEKVATQGLGAIVDIAAARVFPPAYLADHPQAIDERRAVLLNIDPVAFQAACALLVDADLTPGLAGLKIPTLVVCGELDQATPVALNREIADGIPGARFLQLMQCGHCPPLEQPLVFLAAIGEFLEL